MATLINSTIESDELERRLSGTFTADNLIYARAASAAVPSYAS